jgi:hypothetical protein
VLNLAVQSSGTAVRSDTRLPLDGSSGLTLKRDVAEISGSWTKLRGLMRPQTARKWGKMHAVLRKSLLRNAVGISKPWNLPPPTSLRC